MELYYVIPLHVLTHDKAAIMLFLTSAYWGKVCIMYACSLRSQL